MPKKSLHKARPIPRSQAGREPLAIVVRDRDAALATGLPIHGEKRGFEIIGGKQIPFVLHRFDEDYSTTTYGSHDGADHSKVRTERIGGRLKTVHGTTLLVRHDKHGKSFWGIVYNGRLSIGGKACK